MTHNKNGCENSLMIYYTWNHLTVCKQMSSGLFEKCYLQTIHLKIIHITGFGIK